MTLIPENVKKPRKTYFNPFTLFRFRGIKPSATATDKAIRTLAYEPRKDRNNGTPTAKNADKTWILQKKNLNQTLSYSI